MHYQDLPTPSGPDWKGIGYLVSIVSVFFLGALAWPQPNEPRWHLAALIGGMATSIAGMGFRYMAHLQQQKEIRKAKAEARRN
jgi:F0F1-type ATP synthase assembly protein I